MMKNLVNQRQPYLLIDNYRKDLNNGGFRASKEASGNLILNVVNHTVCKEGMNILLS